MHDNENGKLWNKSYLLILILSAMTSIAFNMITPILTKYVVSMGAKTVLAGVIAGMFSITALFARPFAGFSSDRYNKKKLLMLSTLLLGLATLCYGLSTSIPMLILVRIVHGVAFAFSGTANTSLCTTFIPKKRLGEGIGYMGLGYILSTAVGPNLGIVISQSLGYKYVFYLSFLIIMTAVLLMGFLKADPAPKSLNGSDGAKRKLEPSSLIAKELLIFAVLAGFYSLMNGFISNFLVLLGDERNISNIGLYFTINAMVLLLARPLSGRLLDKKGLAFIAFPSFILSIVAAVLLGSSQSLWMVLLASGLYALGQGSAQPAIQTTCIRKLGPERVGIATSTYFIGADVGQGIGPILGGAATDLFGFSSVFYGGAAVLFIGMLIFYFYNKKLGSDMKVTAKAQTP